MNRTKSIFAAVGMTIIMGLLAACGAPEDIPKMAEMNQIGINAQANTALDQDIAELFGQVFDVSGTYNWTKTSFESTKSLEETTAFYSADSLAAAGWNAPDMPGCQDITDGGKACMVAKAANNALTVAYVKAYAQDGKVYVVWVRVEGMKQKAS